MFISFFLKLREMGIRPAVGEYLALLEALERQVVRPGLEDFYYLCRSLLVKHESQYDGFDRAFGQYFRGLADMQDDDFREKVPDEWLKTELLRHLSPEELAQLEAQGGAEALLDRFRALLAAQESRHTGGNTFMGTEGTSGMGQAGESPTGVRAGAGSGMRSAGKVWEQRLYANLREDQAALEIRDLKMVLKRLRLLTREGRPSELDMERTVRRTSANAGMLDIRMRPSRKNQVKVLLLLDIGGSMDDHIAECLKLFTASRHAFKHLTHYYFHNCLYEYVWQDNTRRMTEKTTTWELIHTYNRTWRVIIVGDAAMAPAEILYPGGSVEHHNPESGKTWLERLQGHFPHLVWINPSPERAWGHYPSTGIIRDIVRHRMYPMNLAGLTGAMKALLHPHLQYVGKA
ncbi:MAG: VWA domain-containing protein [Bacteroidia bacterium]|nr:VWA domain-containing protein [Bacteroidia bacterium]